MVHVREKKWYGACDTPRPSKCTPKEAVSLFITSITVHHITSLVLLLMSISINTPALGCAPFLHVLYCISRPFPVYYFPWLFAIYYLIISVGEIATIVDHLCCWHTFTSPCPLVISVLCLVTPAMGPQIWKLIVTLLVSTQFRCPRRIPNPPKQLESVRN